MPPPLPRNEVLFFLVIPNHHILHHPLQKGLETSMIETNPVGRGQGGLSSHKCSPTNTNDPNAPWNGSNGPSVWPCWVPKSGAASAGGG